MEKLINEHGYWTINEKNFNQHHFDLKLAVCLVNYFKSVKCKSVLDVGCGDGRYVNCFNENKLCAIGYDGNPNTLEITNNTCNTMDFSVKCDLQKCDWVLSLEVGEHIPQQYEQIYTDNLINNCETGIILSWAIPGQPGFGHVNCKSNEYIKNIFLKSNFTNDINTENELRQNASLGWFKNTIMVFKKY